MKAGGHRDDGAAQSTVVRALGTSSQSMHSRTSRTKRVEICGASVPRVALEFQRIAGWICLLPLSLAIIALMHLRGRYRINRHAEIRRRFWKIARSREPLIICANHLTLIDSVIILWALASTSQYLFNYRLFCWNFPAIENTKKRWSWRMITYLSKCILVDRLGDSQHTDAIIDMICYLQRSNQICMLFPEGTRSRSGRVNHESATYGIGKILQKLPECRVLCIYLRGCSQASYSDFPQRGEVFDLEMEVLRPMTDKHGLRGVRELSRQVISTLSEMEGRYFEQRTSCKHR